MTVGVYKAKTSDALFTHLVENSGDGLAVFTEECCQTKKITELSLERIQSVLQAAIETIGQSQFQRGTRSYILNVQGIKKNVVISMTSFTVLSSGDLK